MGRGPIGRCHGKSSSYVKMGKEWQDLFHIVSQALCNGQQVSLCVPFWMGCPLTYHL